MTWLTSFWAENKSLRSQRAQNKKKKQELTTKIMFEHCKLLARTLAPTTQATNVLM